jgi:hypothetical protein
MLNRTTDYREVFFRILAMRQARLLVWLLLLLNSWMIAQPEQPVAANLAIESYCGSFANNVEHGEALRDACRFVLTLREKLPNFICDQTTERHNMPPVGMYRPFSGESITARVRYEDGRESYSNILVGGKPVAQMSEVVGSWSNGEFGSFLRAVVGPASAPQFKFKKRSSLRGKEALVFEYRVEQRNNKSWSLEAPTGLPLLPGIRGELWINAPNHHLLRLVMEATDVDRDFYLQKVKNTVDYADTHMGDGTDFVMPTGSEARSCFPTQWCQRNVLRFTNCHKFGVNTRILPTDAVPETPR